MPYVDNTERAQDNRASAWALLIVGGIALVVAILGFAGVLPFQFAGSYFLYGIVAVVLGVLFLVMGFVSLKSAKSYSKRAESEKFLRDTILKWCQENVRAEAINAEVEDYGVVPEEEIYFRRMECLKSRINRQFINLDQEFVEHFIDETIYDMIFGQSAQE